jgi:hypothetical protein
MVKPYTPRYDWPIKVRPNLTAKIPYAYMADPEDDTKLIPNPELIPHIERALEYINEGNSIRSVASWLSTATKKSITFQGLDYIWEAKCGSDPRNPIVIERRKRKRARAPKTEEEKEQFRIKKELRKAKTKVTRETNKLAIVQAQIAERERLAQIEPEEIEYLPFDSEPVPVIPRELENREIAFTPNPGPQTEFLAAPEREVLYGGAAGGGKVGHKNSYILTPFGFKKWDALQVGDLVNHPSGSVQKIVQLHPWVKLPQWIVEFSDGTKLKVAKDHLWQAWKGRKGRKINNVRTFGEDSAEVIETHTLKEWLDRGYNPQIPVCMPQPFNTASKSEDIDPYMLGLLLGDGCITTEYPTIACEDADRAFYASQFLDMDANLNQYQRIVFRGEYRKELVRQLEKYKLIGTRSNTKFIPDRFKTAPLPMRYALIQGLMDTDGYNDPKDNGCYYYSVSKQLADDVAWILRSLGCVVTINEKPGSYRNDVGEKVECQLCYCLYIKTRQADRLFRLPRKKYNRPDIEISKRVTAVYEEGEIEGRCITVSNPNGLYITDDFIVTHNSYALLADPMRYFDHPSFRGLILRRTNDELRELKWKSKELYSKTFPDAKWKEQMSMWVFPSGAELWLTYLERDDDVLRYQGQAFSYIAIDELTQYATPFAWDYMRSRLRTTAKDLPIFMRATSNPGGPGHLWVKKMFVDPAVPGEAFNATDIETGEPLIYPKDHHDRSLRGLPLFQRRFIPARLSDNPYLYQGGDYEAGLLSLPEAQRRKLLEGDWSIVDGAAFPEFSTYTHVIEPYKIPSNWRKFRSADFGYSSYSAVHWFAIDPVYETLIVYRELYVSKCTAIDLALKIKHIEAEAGERVMYGVLDSSTWHQRGHNGPSIAEEMIGQGVSWRASDRTKGSRTAGFNRLHELLKTTPYSDGKQMPGIVFFNNCRQIIADLQVIPVHPDGMDDIDDRYTSDHTYDSIRYGIMSRPRGQSPWDFEVTSISSSHMPADRVFGY